MRTVDEVALAVVACLSTMALIVTTLTNEMERSEIRGRLPAETSLERSQHIPPREFMDDATAIVRFVDADQIRAICGPEAGACQYERDGRAEIAMLNPCRIVRDNPIDWHDASQVTITDIDQLDRVISWQRAYWQLGTQCHEIAHVNGWRHVDHRSNK